MAIAGCLAGGRRAWGGEGGARHGRMAIAGCLAGGRRAWGGEGVATHGRIAIAGCLAGARRSARGRARATSRSRAPRASLRRERRRPTHDRATRAEGAGFEPAVRVNGLRFSRPVHSTALPPLPGGLNVCAMPETAAPLLTIHRPADRADLVRRARLLAWAGLGWHAV